MTPVEIYNKFVELKEQERLPDSVERFYMEDNIFWILYDGRNRTTDYRVFRFHPDHIDMIHINDRDDVITIHLKPSKDIFFDTTLLDKHIISLYDALHEKSGKIQRGACVFKIHNGHLRICKDGVYLEYPLPYIHVKDKHYVFFKGEQIAFIEDGKKEKALERIKTLEKELAELKKDIE